MTISIVVLSGLLAYFAVSFFIMTNNQKTVRDSANLYITEFVLPTPNSGPLSIAADSSGDIWIAANNITSLIRFDAETKVFTEFKIPTDIRSSSMWDMAIDKHGKVWFTSASDNSVWRFDSEKKSFTRYRAPTPESFPFRLALDQDGNVWFTELYGGKIGLVKADTKEIVEYEPPTQSSGPSDLFIDSDGGVWFTETFVHRIARFDPRTATFKEYVSPDQIFSPTGIIVGSRGQVWIAEHGGSLLTKLVLGNGSVVKYPTSLSATYPISLPYWLDMDESGNIWFNEHTGNRIGRFDPSTETLVEYVLPSGSLGGLVNALQFTIAPDGRVWFTELTENKIGVIDTRREVTFSLRVPRNASVTMGGTVEIPVLLSGSSEKPLSLNASATFSFSGRLLDAKVQFNPEYVPSFNEQDLRLDLVLELGTSLKPGNYTLGVSASDGAVVVSAMLHLRVLPER